MALLAYGGRAIEDSTYNIQTKVADTPGPRTWEPASYGQPNGSEPGAFGPWPASDGSSGLSDVVSVFGGGAHLL